MQRKRILVSKSYWATTAAMFFLSAAPVLSETIQCVFTEECVGSGGCDDLVYNLSFVGHDDGERYGLVDLDSGSIEGHTRFAFRKGSSGTLLGVDTDSNRDPVIFSMLTFGPKSATMSVQGVDGDTQEAWVTTYYGMCSIKN